MRICLVSAEIAPFAKIGGLGDVSAALGKYLKENGHDIRLVMPLYDTIDRVKYDLSPVKFAQNISLWMGKHEYVIHIWTGRLPNSKTDVYFVQCDELYKRGAVYTPEPDEPVRFALLSVAAFELCQKMGWSPQIFHANDWHTALIPLYLKSLYSWDRLFKSTKTILTIHNIGYQGNFPARIINDLGLNSFYQLFDSYDLFHGRLNFLKSGLLHADKITTVSPTYAREIQTPEYGEGLDGILRNRSHDLVGILNGVDYEEWNPEKDPNIPYHYSVKNLSGKKKNKQVLLEKSGFNAAGPDRPVLGIVGRLVEHKGFDLLMGCIEEILTRYELWFVVLGSGEARYEKFFRELRQLFPDRVVFYNKYDYALSHLIEAGADIFVMPSRYEPCGLNQIYSLRYGTAPVVRKTGGLADTVTPYDWKTQTGDGFVFEHYTPEGLKWALEYALTTYPNKTAWKKIMINGMKKNFSWKKQIRKYERLYASLAGDNK